MQALQWRHPGFTPRRSAGLLAYERVLARAGLTPVAGIDEAGRGACAGPLVVAAVAFDPRRAARCGELADSKMLTAPAREAAYERIVKAALSWHAVVIPPGDIDRFGLHVSNVAGMRRALAGLATRPAYVLTDGFPVRGLAIPALAMWKGDQVAACVAAASIVAKVTRDQIMRDLHGEYPEYGFSRHKGYSTRSHMRALAEHGPSPQHRMSFANVGGRIRLGLDPAVLAAAGEAAAAAMAGDPVPASAAEGFAVSGAEGSAGRAEGSVSGAEGSVSGAEGSAGRAEGSAAVLAAAGLSEQDGPGELLSEEIQQRLGEAVRRLAESGEISPADLADMLLSAGPGG